MRITGEVRIDLKETLFLSVSSCSVSALARLEALLRLRKMAVSMMLNADNANATQIGAVSEIPDRYPERLGPIMPPRTSPALNTPVACRRVAGEQDLPAPETVGALPPKWCGEELAECLRTEHKTENERRRAHVAEKERQGWRLLLRSHRRDRQTDEGIEWSPPPFASTCCRRARGSTK